jgi:hypothetical protein
MLAWIPLLGPILQGLFSTASTIYGKFKDSEVAKLQTTRTNDLEEAKVAAQIIQTTNDDIALRIMRDAMCLPIVVWCMLIGWDTIIAENSWKVYMWHVASFDKTSVPYLPYAVITFLLGNIGINMWNRK